MTNGNLGSAKMVLVLEEGIITAHHGNGTLLYKGTATGKSWPQIVASIVKSCPDGKGPMTQQ